MVIFPIFLYILFIYVHFKYIFEIRDFSKFLKKKIKIVILNIPIPV